jgi:hypothetical protein
MAVAERYIDITSSIHQTPNKREGSKGDADEGNNRNQKEI